MPSKPMNVQSEFADIMQRYQDEEVAQWHKFLILGDYGTGKTYLTQTAPKPVLIHSFDPGGSTTLRDVVATPENDTGIYVVSFESDDPRNPTAYKEWEKTMDQWTKNNWFDSINTFVIDSFSLWSLAMINQLNKQLGRSGGIPALQDYQIIRNNIRDWILRISGLPCHFIMTGHLTLEKDETSGHAETAIDTFKSLRSILPKLFDEIYVTQVTPSSKGPGYKLRTASSGYYKARSRLASNGAIEPLEDPDISAIIEKAKKGGQPSE